MEGVNPDLTVAPEKGMTPPQRALTGAALLVCATVVLVALEGGHPASVWFYPYFAIIGIVAIYRNYTIKNYGELKAVPGESKRRSFEWALVEAAVTGVLGLCALVLLTTDASLLRSQSFLPVVVGYSVYCRRRGEKPSTKTMLLLALAWLAWYVVFLELWRAFR
jgi:hypothetical protein